MAMETKLSLEDKTIEKLEELVRINIDSQKGFEDVADHCDDSRIAELFRNLSAQRARQAAQLQELLAANQEEPPKDGSMAASLHRAWIDLRAALGGGTGAMLSEAERGEDKIKAKYEDALKDHPGSAVSDVLHHHYADVKSAHDRVRDLRDLVNG